jgi:ABC-type sugar transport system permease subunit
VADTAQRRPGLRPASGSSQPGPRTPGRDRSGAAARVRLAAFVRRHKLAPYLLLAPALAGIALVLLWPLVQVVIYSFQNYGLPQLTGAAPTQWAGFSNFTSTFADPEFWVALRNTVLFAVVIVPLTLIVGTLIGLLLHRLGRRMGAFVSAAALLAWATPPTAGAVLFYWMFNPDGGLVDWSLSRLPHWLVGSTNWAQYNWTTTGALQAYTVLTLLVLWTSYPFIAVSVLAGLKTIPAELYEAAAIDGASRSRVFWRVTYPLLKPIFLVLLLLSVIWDFNVFNQIYLISGYPGNQNEYNLALYMYDKAFGFPPSYGLGGALALIFTLILLVITVGYVRSSVRQGALT